ncbi:MAG: carboxypeptidase-like regulatory domain-containing protein [Bacteroidetes bacterium]|nr:carboxypeptidase-like regulatory domain-containing protein [Bacteroidota bacterium]
MGLLTASHLSAQDRYKFFYGKVVDQVSKKPVANVNLSIPGSKTGTVTGKNGEFSFFTDSIPASLVVSHVGYVTKNIILDATSYSLTIYLLPAVAELAEVEIKANANEAFFKDDHYAVLDYEIDSNMVYLLIFRQYLSKSELICKSIYGDTVATSTPFYFRPYRLFRDCLGALHVLSHDSGFQVFRQGNLLHLIHAVNLKKFDDVLKNCVAATPEVLFFQRVTDLGQGVEYYGINRKTFKKNAISRVGDEKKKKMLRRNSEDAWLMGSMVPPDSREDFVTWNYVHKILYRPIKTSLYRIGEFTCIFNTPDRQIEFYDLTGNFSYKLALRTDQVSDGRWTNDVIIDERSGKVYTTFVSNGQYSLYGIDLNSGVLKKRMMFVHYYPEKIRVYNDFVYYLYNVPGDPDNKMLYRQKF